MKICATVLLGPKCEEIVGEAIASIVNDVDTIAVFMSGGTSKAQEAAREAAGDKFRYAGALGWNGSYGGARNGALDWCRQAGFDFALTLDPDERVSLAPNFRNVIDAHPNSDIFGMRDQDTKYVKERIIRCDSPAKWIGRVCEFLDGARGQHIVFGNYFSELPKSKEGERARWERALVEIPETIKEDKERSRWYRHLGSSQMGLGKKEEAYESYKKGFEIAETPDERAWLGYLICEQMVLADDFDGAREFGGTLLVEYPGFLREFGWILAYTAYKKDMAQCAIGWAQMVTQIPDNRRRAGFHSKNAVPGCQNIIRAILKRRDEIENGKFPAEFYRTRRRAYKSDYSLISSFISDVVNDPSAHYLDLGAGAGLLVEGFLNWGLKARGVELELEAEEACPKHVRPSMKFGVNASKWADEVVANVVTCFEVMEHIPEEEALVALDGLCDNVAQWLFFTAAQPGQPGHGHINCQPLEYWREKIEAKGLSYQKAITDDLKKQLYDNLEKCIWIPDNLMVFRRA